MAFSLRGVVAVAVPAVVMLFGFLWFRKRKKLPAIDPSTADVKPEKTLRDVNVTEISETSAHLQSSSVIESVDADRAAGDKREGQYGDVKTATETEAKTDAKFNIQCDHNAAPEKYEKATEEKAEMCFVSPAQESSVMVGVGTDAEQLESSYVNPETHKKDCSVKVSETVSSEKSFSSEKSERKETQNLRNKKSNSVFVSSHYEEPIIPTSVHQSESVSQGKATHQSESLSQQHILTSYDQPETKSLPGTVPQSQQIDTHVAASESKPTSVQDTMSQSKWETLSNIDQQSDAQLKSLLADSKQHDSNHQSELTVTEHQSLTSTLPTEKQSETACENHQVSEANQEALDLLNKSDSYSKDEITDRTSLDKNTIADLDPTSPDFGKTSQRKENSHPEISSSGDWSKCSEEELHTFVAESSTTGQGDQLAGNGTSDFIAVESPTEKLMISSQASSGCDHGDANSEISNDSGKGTSVIENGALSSVNGHVSDVIVYEFNFPTDLCGRLIGRMGKNINQLKMITGAQITVGQNHYSTEHQTVVVKGTQEEVDNVLAQIRKKFPAKQYPNVDLSQVVSSSAVSDSNLPLLPEIMQLSLPEGVSMDVLVSSIVDAGHVFAQQPTHPTFSSLERLNQCMIMCYSQDATVPQLPRPIDFGVICAAPMLNGWYRAQVIAYYQETDECDIKYVDYGGYSRIPAPVLRQIRSDFTTLPFQAVECYLANVTSLPDEVGFSIEASAVLEEYVQGKLLQAQIVGRADDGVPYIQIYSMSGNMAVLVNRELVNRGVARWVEQQ